MELTTKYLDTGSHGAVAVENYIFIDSSAAEVIKLWKRKSSFVKWKKGIAHDSGKARGTVWHRTSREGRGFGWFQSEIVLEEVCNYFHCITMTLSY
jgi:hypothetical protein